MRTMKNYLSWTLEDHDAREKFIKKISDFVTYGVKPSGMVELEIVEDLTILTQERILFFRQKDFTPDKLAWDRLCAQLGESLTNTILDNILFNLNNGG